MVGSIKELGSWDPHQSGIRLTWSDGHIWRVKFKTDDLPTDFEFKFVIIADSKVVRWEGKQNHKFNLPDYSKKFSQPDAIEALKDGGLAGGVVNLTFEDSKDMVSYNKHKKRLDFFSPWQAQ